MGQSAASDLGETSMQKTAHELLAEINLIALATAPAMPTDGLVGCLMEVETKGASDPNWTFHWRKLPENDRDFSLKLDELKKTYQRIDWSKALRAIRKGADEPQTE
jgi:hypothetical protein